MQAKPTLRAVDAGASFSICIAAEVQDAARHDAPLLVYF